MKRKRGGSKKRKAEKANLVRTNEEASVSVSLNTEENSGDNEDADSGMDAETETTSSPPRAATQPETLANADTIGRPNNNIFGKAVYTRVKVKIKTSKASDAAPSQSDTDRSSQQVGSEKQQGMPSEKMDDSANSLSEPDGNTAQKPTGIKIKSSSSRGLGSSSMSPCSNAEPAKGDRVEKKDTKFLEEDSKQNEQELRTALELIRKIMKMDAAEPFNIPVDPVALGIPDYFDVIDTPMDFGTICSNLEQGKYTNSEDVFIDVQHIWDNCYKYNNKGDYIVELMKRVKKAFIKSWAAAGLFSDQPQESHESNPAKDLTPSSEGNNTPTNGSALTLSSKKFHGLKKHKEGCQCAICVMMRRRQEREEIARFLGGPTYISDDSLGEDIKTGRISHGESSFGEYALSNIEDSPDADAEMEKKGQDLKVGRLRDFYLQQNEDDISVLRKREGSQDQSSHRSGDENGMHHHTPQKGSGGDVSNDTQRENYKQNEDGSAAIDQQRPKELLDKNRRAKMLENLRYLDNPMLLQLYGTLFMEKSHSLWNGPHSLVGRKQQQEASNRHSSLSSAISSFMK